ncbi:MAG TPA: NAD(P)/FAD-dependent oxidoreductase [Chloroflexota bacterium]|nr:NAD(P)/FAD-dependent oxidoreductase [Chloroflexota bacterium]
MYDAIVVGARCGGASTAMLLARKGYRILLVDRSTFPSDIVRLHFVRPPGVARLKRWGLLDRVAATGCPAIRKLTIDMGDFPLVGIPSPIEDVCEHYGPRRTVLDTILVEAAVEAGVELRTGFSVQELLWDGERVVGIRGQAQGGGVVSERARVVVGADGMHSIVARGVDAPVYNAHPTLACYYYSYWADLPMEGLEVYRRDHQLILTFPTNDGLTCVCVAWQHSAFHEVRSDIEAKFFETIDLVPEFAERVRAGQRMEPFRGTGDLPNFFRRPFGPGWALVGDAGYHKDPYLAFGISDAFLCADLLAEALDAGFSGHRPIEEAEADYERLRNETVIPLYQLNLQLARLEQSTPEQVALRAALRGNDEDTSRFLGVTSGTVPLPEFFAPDNLRRIMTAAHARASSAPVAATSA